jgi:hypothetical protein
MTETTPDGITQSQWQHYNMGRRFHAEGLGAEAAKCVFDTTLRSWCLAGWHDADIEAGGKTAQDLIRFLDS